MHRRTPGTQRRAPPSGFAGRGRRSRSRLPWLAVLLAGWLAAGCGDSTPPGAASVAVAVAANFVDVQTELSRGFEALTGHRVTTSSGATGQLYAQVVNGAPFDVFLSADRERPLLLEEAGLAVAGTRSTYAIGRLVLYGPRLDSVRAGGVDLASGAYAHLAIANPTTAPYGAAAEDVLARLGFDSVARPRVVQGESIAQTHQFVRSGAAELGFVALSQVIGEPSSSYWLVPPDMHSPILQDMVLLRHAEQNDGARAYLEFLRSEEARHVIESFGYGVSVVGSRRHP